MKYEISAKLSARQVACKTMYLVGEQITFGSGQVADYRPGRDVLCHLELDTVTELAVTR